MFDKLRSYAVQQTGAIAIAFAVMAPALVGMTGMALDLGQSFLVRQRLAGALDAAALAATASATTEDGIQAQVDTFMAANYPANKVGNLIIDSVDVTVEGDDVTVVASANYDTYFMSVLGIDHLTVSAMTKIHRAIKGLEAVLVLDNTGSMGSTNMNHLKTASTNFVDILFDRAASPEDIKIGIVPYSNSVRIGFYGLGKVPDDDEFDSNGWDGTYAQYSSGTKFINYPPNGVNPFLGATPDVKYVTIDDKEDGGSKDDGWYGCVVEHKPSGYNSAATHVPGSYGQLWSTHATAGKCKGSSSQDTVSNYCKGHGWNPKEGSNNNPYDNNAFDGTDPLYTYEGPWDIYMYGDSDWEDNSGSSNDGFVWDLSSNPTSYCPWALIQPMISNETTLKNHIQTMQHEGGTYSNIGMLWGLRLISPEPPFTEGTAWDNEEWNKAIVLMTDGEMSPIGSGYSAYWDEDLTSYENVTEMNNRLKETCTYLKSKGVIIYTVNFKHASSDISESTKQVYKDCATQPWQDYYKFVTTGAQLTEMFEEIAAALSRLHISQ